MLISNSNNAKLINIKTHSLHSLISGHEDTVLCCEYFHPYILTGGKDKLIKLWCIDQDGRTTLIANYRGHSDDVASIGLLFGRKMIVSVGEDRTIKLWTLYSNRT